MVIISLSVNGQTDLSKNNNLNLPPGSVLAKKFEFIDYSYRLNYIASNTSNVEVNKNFLQEFSEAELTEIKNNTPEKYQYYLKAQDFYNALSNNVKSAFTVSELWYVYMYDVELTNKLRLIK